MNAQTNLELLIAETMTEMESGSIKLDFDPSEALPTDNLPTYAEVVVVDWQEDPEDGVRPVRGMPVLIVGVTDGYVSAIAGNDNQGLTIPRTLVRRTFTMQEFLAYTTDPTSFLTREEAEAAAGDGDLSKEALEAYNLLLEYPVCIPLQDNFRHMVTPLALFGYNDDNAGDELEDVEMSERLANYPLSAQDLVDLLAQDCIEARLMIDGDGHLLSAIVFVDNAYVEDFLLPENTACFGSVSIEDLIGADTEEELETAAASEDVEDDEYDEESDEEADGE